MKSNNNHYIPLCFTKAFSQKKILKRLSTKSYILIIILLIFNTALFAQNIVIKGKVTSDDGKPMQGASVKVKGTNIGVNTNDNGMYQINIALSVKNPVLTFSYLAYSSQEIAVNGLSEINANLKLDIKTLSDVVVLGYGSQRKKDLTGSVVSVKRSDFENQPLLDVSQTLKGLAPGVSVSQGSGAPGSDVKIRIRGASSILGNNSPLIVIDGIQTSISLSALNPNDIETIDVLKDASSTAIYGSRGANGVINITTKRGTKDGTAKFEFNQFVSASRIATKFDVLNAIDYANTTNKLNPGAYSPSDLEYYKAFGGTDWQDVLVQDGLIKSTNLSVNGGTTKNSYLISGNYVDEKGIVIGSSRKRYNLRTNIQSTITNKLSVGLNLSGSYNTSQNVSQNYEELWDAINWSPTEAVFEDDGSYNFSDLYGSIRRNPYMKLKERNSNGKSFTGIVGSNLNYKITPKLTFNALLGIDLSANNFGFSNNKFFDPPTSAGQGNSSSTGYQANATLTYLNTFKSIHNVTALVGYEQQKSEFNSFDATGTNFLLTSVDYYNLGLGANSRIASSYGGQALRSFFGRANYSYKDKYLFTATYRADGSSKFRGSNQYSFFPSAALAWRASEEEFIKNFNIFDNLKIRTSYGITGNQAIQPYGVLALLASSPFSFGGTTGMPGFRIQGAGNDNLKWEETRQLDMGIDVAFFKNRVSLTVDLYNRKTSGLLQATRLPDYNGGGNIIKNIGQMENKGVDVGLNIIPVANKNFNLTTALNFSVINNKIISLGNEQRIFPPNDAYYVFGSNNSHVLQVGQHMGSFWGIKHLGVWQQNEAAEAAKVNSKPGDNKYLDLNGDNKLDGSDYDVIGNSLPKYRWGLNNTLTYKRFTLNFFIEAVTGFSVFNGQFAAAAIPSSNGRTITLIEGADFWTPTNTGAKYANPKSETNLNFPQSSQWLQNGSFLRFKNISLGYTLDKSKIKFANIRIYGSAQNIFTLTKFIGADPEGTVSAVSDTYGGYSAGTYPISRTFTLGIVLSN